MKDKKALKSLSKWIMFANYLVHLAVLSVIFVAINLLILPFAYLKTIVMKVKLSSLGVIGTHQVFKYILIGMPLLLFLQMLDLVDFI